jgi:hypothetical protein
MILEMHPVICTVYNALSSIVFKFGALDIESGILYFDQQDDYATIGFLLDPYNCIRSGSQIILKSMTSTDRWCAKVVKGREDLAGTKFHAAFEITNIKMQVSEQPH